MSFFSYLKDKVLSIILIIFSLFTIYMFLMIYNVDSFIKIYIPSLILLSYFIGLYIEYMIRKKYYTKLYGMLNQLESKYLITEIVKCPSFMDGIVLNNVLEIIDRSMHENVNQYKYSLEDYKEYIELWIHEIKTPISVSKMIIENNKNKITKSINEEIDRIENYVEQALFYARSNTVEKDYFIKKCSLKNIVNESVKRNKTSLIQEKISINVHDLDNCVNTDSKWLVFILNQIIQNSIKYRNKSVDSNIEIYSKCFNDNVILYIVDNGVGIKDSEISKVFDKGFTGSNGRISGKKSTGIGLYLCKKLCDKLGINIELSSKYQNGTITKIIFPNSSFMTLK